MLNSFQKYKAEALKVNVYPSTDDMATAAATDAQKFLRAAISVKGRAAVILATGNSQLQFLEKLTASNGINWSVVTLFHMDEYLGIAADHSASFRRYLKVHVEDKVKPLAFHYLQGDVLEPIAECQRYEALLSSTEIDLCCMGIGENGHLAFNDPPVANFTDKAGAKIVRLDEACRKQQVGEGHFPSIDAMPQYAMTLTIPQLLNADRIQCVVPDKRKAQAVKAALNGPITTACPASILRSQRKATLYLDSESAGLTDFSEMTLQSDSRLQSAVGATKELPPQNQ